MSRIHNKTLNRLQQLMLEYDFTVEYIRGKENVCADHLSRHPIDTITIAHTPDELKALLSDTSGDLVEAQQRTDRLIRDIASSLRGESIKSPDDSYIRKIERIAANCTLQDGLIWHLQQRKGRRPQKQLVVPQPLHTLLLQVAHESWAAGHGGEAKTLDRLLTTYWWPGITTDVNTFVRRCPICQSRKGRKPIPAPLFENPLTTQPNERVHMDLFSPVSTPLGQSQPTATKTFWSSRMHSPNMLFS